VGELTAWAFAGQGSQRKGMGAPVFDRYPEHCAAADAILGYSIRELCLENPGGRLGLTQFAQPAIYVVGALHALAMAAEHGPPDLAAGHSVGEYAALGAAGCFDFATGLSLVKLRGELMGQAQGGGMLAVLELPAARVAEILAASGGGEIDLANYNLPKQLVLSGPRTALQQVTPALVAAGARAVPLDVSAAFHSRYMADAAARFAEELRAVRFAAPRWPVLSNVTARPYEGGDLATLLAQQIRAPVRWYECMRALYRRGVRELREVGRSRVLSEMWRTLRADPAALADDLAEEAAAPPAAPPAPPAPPTQASSASPAAPGSLPGAPAIATALAADRLGSAEFRRDHGVRYAYLAGSMFRGVASVALVTRMARAGLLGFLGTGGLALAQIDQALGQLAAELGPGRFGANLLHQLGEPEAERALVELYLRRDVRCVEAAAFLQITPALVQFRFHGARRDGAGAVAPRRIIAKVSRPELAAAFYAPPPEELVRRLRDTGRLSDEEAEVAGRLPMSQDVCVESDSAGHTDGGVALALLPVMRRVRDQAMARHGYRQRLRLGASGGLGTPDAVAAAFVLGADFVVTGSVNQCSPEAGTSDAVKELLAGLEVPDTTYAPAGDMFELGARVQVVRKGTLFAARGNQLYQLYRQHDSLESMDARTRGTLEGWFRHPLPEVWRQTCAYLAAAGKSADIQLAERTPKHRMALVFRWYFARSIRAALDGDLAERANYQIHCGPAMGAWNAAVRGGELEPWRARHVDRIAEHLMRGAADQLGRPPTWW
jgi:trans-AT polyketide synthase, acyltransferase and oxidoreductase domains